MKKIYSQKKAFSLIGTIAIALSIFIFSSCSKKMTFGTSQIAPAATGSVKIKKNKNDNYQVVVQTTHLAKPEQLTPPKNVYVVWMRTEDNAVRNIGKIKSSSGLLSRTLKGELVATSTSKPTSFFITAENDGNIQYPGNEVILQTK